MANVKPSGLKKELNRLLKKGDIEGQKAANKVTRATLISIFGNIIEKTPVDEGRARSNWFVTKESPSNLTVLKRDKDKDSSYVAKALPRDVLGVRMFLTNNLPYIRKLEYGHSGQAPRGMVRISLVKFKSTLNRMSKLYGKRK